MRSDWPVGDIRDLFGAADLCLKNAVLVRIEACEAQRVSLDILARCFMVLQRTFIAATFAALTITPAAAAPDPVSLRDGDRVVFLGSTFIERLQYYGYLETFLTTRHPEWNLTFRNLGWSGDNVHGHSRTVFEPLDRGLQMIQQHVTDAKPTVIFVYYGSNESFAGASGVFEFVRGYQRLLDVLKGTGARICLLSPLPHESRPPPHPPVATRNKYLAIYGEAVAKLAELKKHGFIDLFRLASDRTPREPLTYNGIHLSEEGHFIVARLIAKALGYPVDNDWTIDLKQSRARLGTATVQLTENIDAARGFQFDFQPEQLFLSGPDGLGPNLRVDGLPAGGEFKLVVDGREFARGDAAAWKRGVQLRGTPPVQQAESLRELAVKKNFLYFHRYRPANWPYIFGFRKHEQGNNAVEIPQFDPIIERLEKRISTLRVPRRHTVAVELVPSAKGGEE